MKGWNEYKLNDLADFPPKIPMSRGEIYPFIEMEEIDPSMRHVYSKNRRTYQNSSCSKFKDGDILLARITPCLENGKIAQAKLSDGEKGFGSTEFFVFRAKKGMANQSFLFYLTKCDLIWKNAVNSMVGASGRQRADAGFLKRIRIKIPSLPIQQKIASILSAYDDLIENNNRRIAILEKMAEELYREWFVRLRFPGHEKVKIVKGVPEGWVESPIEQAFEFLGGGTPSTSNSAYWNHGDINWYSPTDLTANKAFFSFESKQKITETGLKESAARLFPPYSIMMTSRATIGEISINTTPACTNQGFITCIPNDKLPVWYLVFWLKSNVQTFIQLANGATFLEITKGKFKRIPILIPKKDIIEKYCFVQEPLTKHIEKIFRKNLILNEFRKRLLVRLMSGKMDVENMDIEFPASMKEELAHA